MNPEWLGVLWLLGLLAFSCLYLGGLYRRSDYSTWETCLYLPTYLLGRLLWRVHFTNDFPSAIRGGAILAANHRSSVDPFFVQLAARRRIHWMVAKEYCQHFAFGPLLKALQVIPTNRSGMDTASTKAALRITQAGRLVGMFPEGRINQTTAPLLPLRSGAALVASRSRVPLIPLWIQGSPLGHTVWSPLWMPARVAITFGDPIWPDGFDPNGLSSAELDSAVVSRKRPTDGRVTERTIVAGGETVKTAETIGENDFENDAARGRKLLVECDALILQWGQQILRLAEREGTPVVLVSQRKRTRKA